MIFKENANYHNIQKFNQSKTLKGDTKMNKYLTNLIMLLCIISFFSCNEDDPTQPNESNTITYAGKTYHTVQIGSQYWLKENLDVGTMIQGGQRATDNGTIEKYCYDNNPANCTIYGGLYPWNEAMQYDTTTGARGICPPGWHIPTMDELNTLRAAVNNDGNSLKAIGQGTGSGTGTNTSGFSALLAGYATPSGYFYDLGDATHFWTTTPTSNLSDMYEFMDLSTNDSSISWGTSTKYYGFSVRCVKD
jgi:uncharacterized protein (TIGR02145 family)